MIVLLFFYLFFIKQEEIIDPYLINIPYDTRLEILDHINILIDEFNHKILSSKDFPVFIRESQDLYKDKTHYGDYHDFVLWNEFARLLKKKGYNVDTPNLVTSNCPDQVFDRLTECIEIKIRGII